MTMKPLHLLLVPLLAGCLAEGANTSREDRIRAVEEMMGQTPRPRTFRYADGELRVLEVPMGGAQGVMQMKHCFIWRDTEFKTSSISCDMPGPALKPTD
jgi:hypothetical protein